MDDILWRSSSNSTGYVFTSSPSGGLITVLLINMLVTFILMIVYYNLRSKKVVDMKQDEGEESEILLKPSSSSSSSSSMMEKEAPVHDGLVFPEDWRYLSNPVSRFLSFWSTWISTVVLIRQEDVEHHVGFDAACYLQVNVQYKSFSALPFEP